MDQDRIIGSSGQTKELLTIARRVARTEATVLLTGESGVGKELLARYIQGNSHRSDKQFIEINCAAIPASLLESELFGYVKGAFTDAVSDFQGKVGAADGGTLFLDEVGDIDLATQAKLLRFLQFKSYQRVGSNEEFYSDIRIIAATNKKLSSMIQEGLFREDLYYRLNVVNLNILPLRERKDDIFDLARFFLHKFAAKYTSSADSFADEAEQMLLAYDWPGNVRELENCIERAVVFEDGSVITGRSLNLESQNDAPPDEIVPLKEALYNFKRDYIIGCLEKNNWHQTETAKKLKIQRTYLARLIKELHINKL